jgi:hypothetical protein
LGIPLIDRVFLFDAVATFSEDIVIQYNMKIEQFVSSLSISWLSVGLQDNLYLSVQSYVVIVVIEVSRL